MSYPGLIIALSGGEYGVDFPDLPGARAVGATAHEAAEAATDVLLARLERLAAAGEAPPQPSRLEDLAADPGEVGRVLVRAGPFTLQRANITMDGLLLARIDRAAQRAGMTRSQFLAEAGRRLTEAVEAGAAEPPEALRARAVLERMAREQGVSVEALLEQGEAYGRMVTGG